MRVAVIENMDLTLHGQVGVALHEAGAKVEVFRPFLDQRLPNDPASYDGIVVFGGEQSAIDDDLHPYLPRLAALLADAAASDRAVLGICLGSQVLARALGGQNRVGAAPEFGWQDVALTEAGLSDPVLSALPRTFRPFQWHSDTFTLPPGAAHLAQSDGAQMQAYRFGRATYGMQFHFEANRAVVRHWLRENAEYVARNQPGYLERHDALDAEHGAAADAAGLAIARAWVALL